MNTAQFDWVLNKMPEKPQPVTPIYAPELMAKAMVHAAEHPRRRAWWIGLPTVYAVLGNGVSPQFMDWYLARSGESGQLTDEVRPAGDVSNLWEPQNGPDGRDSGTTALAAVGAAGLAGLALRRRR